MSETFEEIISEKVLDELVHNFRCDIEKLWGISNVMSEDIGDRVKNLVRTVEKADLAQLEKQIQEELATHKQEGISGKAPREADELDPANIRLHGNQRLVGFFGF